MRAPTVGALGEEKKAKERSLQVVNEHFEPIFLVPRVVNTAIAENGLV